MSIHVYVSQTAGIQPLLAALPVKLSRSRVDRERQRVQHATFTHYKHTQSHPCVASLPGIQRGWQARKTQRTLCSQTCLNMPRSEKVGASRQGDVQAASSREGGETPYISPTSQAIFAHQKLHFRSDADNTVVYSNLLINIPQCGFRENTTIIAHAQRGLQ